MSNSLNLDSVSTKRRRIVELAKQTPKMAFKSLAHHIDRDFLYAAYAATSKRGAKGIDGLTAVDFAKDLEGNLSSLLDGLKSGNYKAPPVRRAHIPKGNGKEPRRIGIPTFEDKVLQRAVTMILESVYEQDFSDSSFGFRPKRSCHQAVERIWKKSMDLSGGYVIDLDIQGFFDALDHTHLRSFLDQRIRDGVIRRMIDKWLKAGVLEDGQLRHAKFGTPQGGVVSPILANIYLHHVFDVWFEEEVQPRLRGRSFFVRYADDIVIDCEFETDARRVMEVIPKRLARFGLVMHPDKTKLINFRSPVVSRASRRDDDQDNDGPPSTFDFLGFTHFWATSKKGTWYIKRKTAKDRVQRTLKSITLWCRSKRHEPIAFQHQKLKEKLQGHCAYFGITGNYQSLENVRRITEAIWQKWLNRRSQRKSMTWRKYKCLLQRFPLPKVRIVHSAIHT